ncbi:MAG TPA: pteridine reductase [Woeseiaceae bacterium]|nr:pteridine reductase [Woeseiaceae bacterium]
MRSNKTKNKMYALVTGSAKRIGASIVKNLHASGLNIGIHYHSSRSDAISLCKELNSNRPDSASIFQADITQSLEARKLIKEFIHWGGKIDLLINNASSFYPTPIGKITDDDWNDLIGTNLKGPLFLCQEAAKNLRETQGSIINLIDIHTKNPLRNHALYVSAKAGLKMLTQSLAKDLAPEIRVNGISPGAILWPEGNINDQKKEAILSQIPLQRKGTPQDISDCILFLLYHSNYITGQTITIDGGRSI